MKNQIKNDNKRHSKGDEFYLVQSRGGDVGHHMQINDEDTGVFGF